MTVYDVLWRNKFELRKATEFVPLVYNFLLSIPYTIRASRQNVTLLRPLPQFRLSHIGAKSRSPGHSCRLIYVKFMEDKSAGY